MTPGKLKRKERRGRAFEARQLLIMLELDPKELARLIHVSWRTVYRWMNGAIPHHKGMRNLRKLAIRRGVRLGRKNGKKRNGNDGNGGK